MCKGSKTSPNQMQEQVKKGIVPNAVKRVDNPKLQGQKPHIHFTDGTALNMDGNVPRWSTVRQRYWKNEAFYHADTWGDQLDRMRKGVAPLDEKGIPYELHHPNGRKGDNLYPLTQEEHRFFHYGTKY